jgi:hypothetical protein
MSLTFPSKLITNRGLLRDLCESGELRLVKILVKHGTEIDLESIKKSIIYNRLEIFKFLIKNQKLDINFSELMTIISYAGCLEMLKFLIEEYKVDITVEDNICVRVASQSNKLDVVKFLIEHGADVSACNSHSLHMASRYDNLEIVKLLLKHGATAPNEETLDYLKSKCLIA